MVSSLLEKNMISSLTAKECCNDQCMKINFFFSLFAEVDRLNQYAGMLTATRLLLISISYFDLD